MATPKKSKAVLRKGNGTGYRGISKLKNGKWIAQINYGHKTHRLGVFSSPAAAAARYDEEATKIFGEKAHLNFPPKEKKLQEIVNES